MNDGQNMFLHATASLVLHVEHGTHVMDNSVGQIAGKVGNDFCILYFCPEKNHQQQGWKNNIKYYYLLLHFWWGCAEHLFSTLSNHIFSL